MDRNCIERCGHQTNYTIFFFKSYFHHYEQLKNYTFKINFHFRTLPSQPILRFEILWPNVLSGSVIHDHVYLCVIAGSIPTASSAPFPCPCQSAALRRAKGLKNTSEHHPNATAAAVALLALDQFWIRANPGERRRSGVEITFSAVRRRALCCTVRGRGGDSCHEIGCEEAHW